MNDPKPFAATIRGLGDALARADRMDAQPTPEAQRMLDERSATAGRDDRERFRFVSTTIRNDEVTRVLARMIQGFCVVGVGADPFVDLADRANALHADLVRTAKALTTVSGLVHGKAGHEGHYAVLTIVDHTDRKVVWSRVV